MRSSIFLAILACLGIQAQTARQTGTVVKIDPAASQLVLKTDAGAEISVTMQPKASFRRIAPGVTDLKQAEVIALADIHVGDRAQAVGKPGADDKSMNGLLIVVMSKADVAKKQAAEQAEWEKRGVVGIVTAVTPGDVSISVSAPGGQKKTLVITPVSNALVRRYAPDSIKFEDAKPSTLAEIRVGDQVRALGNKNEDGSKMTAEEIVSGSFKEIAATILSIDAGTNEMRVTDLATKKPVTVKINPDSNLRKLPLQMAQRLAAQNRPPEEGRGGQGAPPEGRGMGRGEGRGFGGRGGRGGGDLTKLLNNVPKMTLEDLKKGDAIIVLSTVGTVPDQMTAITMLAGVEPILTRPGTREMQLGDWSLGGLGGGGEP